MGKLVCDISVSLEGFVAGPNATLDEPLGASGERLHDWIVGLAAWRERHGLEGGEENGDAEVVDEAQRATGAFLMGRKMFSGGSGPWEDDPNANGWWGDDPPFRVPVFVLTHHAREPETKQGGTSYTFVTDGLESALEQAQAVAGNDDVYIAGGASVVQQALRAGLLDELQLHVAPLLLGGGTRLLDNLGPEAVQLETTRVIESPKVTHLRYRVVR
jgi:dihydrofolate reductase